MYNEIYNQQRWGLHFILKTINFQQQKITVGTINTEFTPVLKYELINFTKLIWDNYLTASSIMNEENTEPPAGEKLEHIQIVIAKIPIFLLATL